jgi:hypothetical protein
MSTLLRQLPGSKLLEQQLPAIVASLLIAETFYTFHSFLLECLAFLATWFVLDFLVTGLANLLRSGRRRDSDL